MKIISTRDFNRPASDLWVVVRDPGNMPAWNPNCIAASRVEGEGLGSQFKATFKMNEKAHQAKGEIISLEEEKEISLRYVFGSESPKLGSIDESYIITSTGSDTSKLRHEIDFTHSGLPWWAKLLISVIGRFGRKVGPDPLDGIAEVLS